MATPLDTQDGVFVKSVSFFFVWNKNGGAPAVTHASRAKANREAIRLAKANPGQKFIVLAATDKFWVTETTPVEVKGFVTAGEALPTSALAQVVAAT